MEEGHPLWPAGQLARAGGEAGGGGGGEGEREADAAKPSLARKLALRGRKRRAQAEGQPFLEAGQLLDRDEGEDDDGKEEESDADGGEGEEQEVADSGPPPLPRGVVVPGTSCEVKWGGAGWLAAFVDDVTETAAQLVFMDEAGSLCT